MLAGICLIYNLVPFLIVDKTLNVIHMNGTEEKSRVLNTWKLALNAP